MDEVICRRRGQEELADESALRDAIAGPICLGRTCINIREVAVLTESPLPPQKMTPDTPKCFSGWI